MHFAGSPIAADDLWNHLSPVEDLRRIEVRARSGKGGKGSVFAGEACEAWVQRGRIRKDATLWM